MSAVNLHYCAEVWPPSRAPKSSLWGWGLKKAHLPAWRGCWLAQEPPGLGLRLHGRRRLSQRHLVLTAEALELDGGPHLPQALGSLPDCPAHPAPALLGGGSTLSGGGGGGRGGGISCRRRA